VTDKCTSIAGHFDGHADVLEQCTRHCPVLHVYGYTRSLWMSPSGKYSLRIAPVAARVACKTRWRNTPYLLAISMAMAIRWYNTAHISQWRRSRALLEDIERHHRVSARSNTSNWTLIHPFFHFSIINLLKKGSR
jgi:hypothetical protein